MIGVIEYGAGNVASVKYACERIGAQAEIISDPARAEDCDRLILPGVGSFRRAMETLHERGWTSAIKDFVVAEKPFLGICLGMQVMFDSGDEDGPTLGLGLIPGAVKLMEPQVGERIPHVGWNSLCSIKCNPLLTGVKEGVDFYFVHSYHCVAANQDDVIALCNYGKSFVAAVSKGSVLGVQFHPEKSQPLGLTVLRNFAERISPC